MTVPLLLSLAVHEQAHARTALVFGDPTARNMGRCTFNPLAHLDLVGTLALIFCGFGWAKPVPVNPHNLRPPRMGAIAVSLAGPMSNLMLALLVALLLRALRPLADRLDTATWEIVWTVGLWTMAANICLFAFNMIPLYPLDGHHILRQQLSADRQVGFMTWQMRYGRWLLLLLVIGPHVTDAMRIRIVDPITFIYTHGVDFAIDHLILR